MFNKRLLIVEDIELNYEITRSMLDDANILYDHAWDGQEAVNMCLKVSPEYYAAILMDIRMPNMDGYTASEIIKTEIGLETPIIVLTTTEYTEETKEEYKGIIDAFLSKPFTYKELFNTLSPYLSDSSDSSVFTKTFITQGIENLGCSEASFKKHVMKFISTYADSTNTIENLFIQKDYEAAHRLAHSIKGLCGTLSFFDLQECAKDLELYLKQFEVDETTRPNSEKEMSKIMLELKPLLDAYQIELLKVCNKKFSE